MAELDKNQESAFVNDDSIYGRETNSIPRPEKNIGMDVKGEFYDNIIEAGLNSQLDVAKLNSLTQISHNRDTILQLLDTMGEDPTVSAALEVYAEDCTETNADGQIIWCESPDANVGKYVNFLLDTLNIDKNIYKWVYSLCKYGDVYIRLFRESDFEDALFDNEEAKENNRKFLDATKTKEPKNLNEDVILKAYNRNEKYAHYVEMMPNPAEMFELTKFGKTYAYIQAEIGTFSKVDQMTNSYFRYSFNKKNVNVYDSTSFVHATLDDNFSRAPEEIQIFLNDKDFESDQNGLRYKVRKGQSILYNSFKIWREMMLLENSLLLNRLTKSSVTRVIGVEVGDMAKEMVGNHLLKIKNLVEQKSALNDGQSLSEYTNPGPVENNVYVPTRGGVGTLSVNNIGGDVNVGQLTDVDFFKNKFFSSLRIPKQFLGDTEDSTGFNGGTSLTLISSRYAKTVKRIQNSVIQMITDMVNLFLLDKGLDSYINRFTIKMQVPTTQEEKDRQEAVGNRINFVTDFINLLDSVGIEDKEAKLEIFKQLISNTINDSDVIDIIQDQIDKIEQEGTEQSEDDIMETELDVDNLDNQLSASSGGSSAMNTDFSDMDFSEFENNTEETPTGETEQSNETSNQVLPIPGDLGLDFTDMES